MTLEDGRRKIDTINREILELLIARNEIVLRIFENKRKNGQILLDAERVKEMKNQIFETWKQKRPMAKPGEWDMIDAVFSTIFEQSLKL